MQIYNQPIIATCYLPSNHVSNRDTKSASDYMLQLKNWELGVNQHDSTLYNANDSSRRNLERVITEFATLKLDSLDVTMLPPMPMLSSGLPPLLLSDANQGGCTTGVQVIKQPGCCCGLFDQITGTLSSFCSWIGSIGSNGVKSHKD